MSHIPQPMGMKYPAFALIRRLIDKRRTWIELSVTYEQYEGRSIHLRDVNKVGQMCQAAPERMSSHFVLSALVSILLSRGLSRVTLQWVSRRAHEPRKRLPVSWMWTPPSGTNIRRIRFRHTEGAS